MKQNENKTKSNPKQKSNRNVKSEMVNRHKKEEKKLNTDKERENEIGHIDLSYFDIQH